MSNRREFLKQAGILTAVPWGKTSAGSGQNEGSSVEGRSATEAEGQALVLENDEMRLVINPKGWAQSLVHKPTGQECLFPDAHQSMFTVTQYMPYDNELMLSSTAKITTYPAENVRREGDNLVVTFAHVGYEGIVNAKVTDEYIAFRLQHLEYKGYTRLRPKRKTPIDETLFVQLPVYNRKNFGGWLNVTWDDDVAVNVLGTDHYAQINALARRKYRLFQAATARDVQLEGVGAALIVTKTSEFLNRVARVEADFDLPRGVESRRWQEYKYSYYEVKEITPQSTERHVHFAKMGGFRTVEVYYRAFAETAGHFPWRPEYPNGMVDLQNVTRKISEAGMIAGVHIHYSKADRTDAYVTPKPDPRLNLRHTFKLTAPLDATATTVAVAENPGLCTMDNRRRILQIQDELVEYERYTRTPPYQFTGCKRGALGTSSAPHELGTGLGLLDVDTWPLFVRFNQDTTIQQEVALRLGKIWQDAGFRFVYFDGAEDVPPPYWFTVSQAQWVVYKQLNPAPLWGEGACRSHFSWHILTRGNAFDVFKPEVMKAATRAYPAAEIPKVAKDFTRINFGWIGYWAPSEQTIGDQPDMLEYVTSRAAAWDCPISFVGDLSALEAHPRTPDNLEVLKRWEDVRIAGWLSSEQRKALRNLDQEYTLLVNEQDKFELVPCEQIESVAGSERPGRAYVFRRKGATYAAFWHTSGEARIEVPLGGKQVRLMKEIGKPLKFGGRKNSIVLPLSNKMYLECPGISPKELVTAFKTARILEN